MHNPHQQVKRFVAPNMRKALDLVREELGPEAIILSSKRVENGVEIITSLDKEYPTRGADVRREFGQNFDGELDRAMSSDTAWRSQAGIEQAAAAYSAKTEQNGPTSFSARKTSSELADEIEKARDKMLAAKKKAHQSESIKTPEPLAVSNNSNISSPSENTRLSELQNELADMRMLLEQQLWHMAETRAPVSNINMPDQLKTPQTNSVVLEHLHRLGIDDSLAEELATLIKNHSRASDAWREAMAHLAKRIPISDENIINHGGVYAFVGQTGVGKTTTIAKLAANFVLQHGPGKVALITTDTYRVGAYEQLRSIGRILNIPVRGIDKSNSLLTLLASLKQFPLILIDTAGFRHGDPLLKEQMRQLDACHMIKRILVLACNSQVQTMKASIHAYSSVRGIDACVLSKLDESARMGEALSVVSQNSLPVAYTTDGQEIPKDIAAATGHGLVAKAVAMLKSEFNNIRTASF